MANTPPRLETLLPLDVDDILIDKISAGNRPILQAAVDAGYHSRGAEVEALKEALKTIGAMAAMVEDHSIQRLIRAALQEVE